jgi:hypothetical protein
MDRLARDFSGGGVLYKSFAKDLFTMSVRYGTRGQAPLPARCLVRGRCDT